jgi:tryptophan 2,3-dioxygenase
MSGCPVHGGLTERIVAEEGAQLDFSQAMSYGDYLQLDAILGAQQMLARVSRIMEQLVGAWSVLATMTPTEYTAMRPYLASSSGFQSYQYRCIEFALGNKNAAMLQPHAHRPDLLSRVEAAWRAPSLYDEALRLLARQGLAIPAGHLERFRHVTTVERVIGFKRGTGGTGGVSYLRKMLDVVLFPEIWSVRTAL